MNTLVHTEKHGEFIVNIHYDHDPLNPRVDWDNLGTIYHTHRNYDLGVLSNREDIQAILNNPDYLTLPVYMYEHGNIALSTGSFSCAWDSGQVGIIAVKKSDALKAFMKKRMTKKLEKQVLESLKGEIETFSAYLSGEVYGYSIEKPNTCESCSHCENEVIDSCWGFIGDYHYCLKEALSNLPKAA